MFDHYCLTPVMLCFNVFELKHNSVLWVLTKERLSTIISRLFKNSIAVKFVSKDSKQKK